MELLYFDFDHGVERLLFVRLDRESQSVHFRFEKSPDPTHDEESDDVPTVTVSASTTCPSLDQFFGFCRALVAAMRETRRSRFRIPASARLPPCRTTRWCSTASGTECAPEELTCRIPQEIAAELVGSGRVPERFKPLVGVHGLSGASTISLSSR